MEIERRRGVVTLLVALLALGVSAQARAGSLPLGRSLAGDRDLPRPYGLGITFFTQTHEYDLARFDLSLPGLDLTQVSGLVIENRLEEVNAKIDLWLWPFLNVFGLVGNVDGRTRVDLSGVDIGLPLSDVLVEYQGLVYGYGVTLAGGGDRFFASLTAIGTETDLDTTTSQVDARVYTPKLGIHGDRGAFWIGGMYQDAQERHQGRITIPFVGEFDFDAQLEESDHWNYVAGASVGFGAHWNLDLEGGFGDRNHTSLALTYRF